MSDYLQEYFCWFESYVKGFFTEEEVFNRSIAFKRDHSLRVCDEMRYLCGELSLDRESVFIAETIALFHDIGRFEQFASYGTYCDKKSINHSWLGREILHSKQILGAFNPEQQDIIETAVELHGARELPPALSGRALFFTQLIRDADKLDIMYIVTENPDGIPMDMGLSDAAVCSEPVVEAILTGEQADYREMKTWNDLRLIHMSWVNDMNFPVSLKRIKSRQYLEKLAGQLPDTPVVRQIKSRIFAFLN